MTFTQIKANIRAALNDLGITFYSEQDLDDSISDAYSDIAFLTGCIINRVNALEFPPNQPYLDPTTLVPDYQNTLAIFNETSNLWLVDDTSLKDFDLIRENWELWNGTTRWWAPVTFSSIALVPTYANPGSLFDLIYATQAPSWSDDGVDSPLIALDMQDLIESYVLADMLEQVEEFTKAQKYWMGDNNMEGYFPRIDLYKERVQLLAKADMFFKI